MLAVTFELTRDGYISSYGACLNYAGAVLFYVSKAESGTYARPEIDVVYVTRNPTIVPKIRLDFVENSQPNAILAIVEKSSETDHKHYVELMKGHADSDGATENIGMLLTYGEHIANRAADLVYGEKGNE